MFKSAATKIAHNSTIPALGLSGNKDLRPLQDLITAEKVVLVSLQKLSQDFTKASEALRVWGVGEGDDLGDILSASTTIFAHFSAALSGYATREHAIRDDINHRRRTSPVLVSARHSLVWARRGLDCWAASQGPAPRWQTEHELGTSAPEYRAVVRPCDTRLGAFRKGAVYAQRVCASCSVAGSYGRNCAVHLKAIRTREEALDELKRRRKATLARADSAEKKLNKMGPEHKNLAQQTDILNQLQMQIRQMDGEIMNEEAALGDFKRTSARALMGLKFGGLMECCEKGCVVAEVGRSIVAEISEETTTPGMSRSTYMGHQSTQQRVIEAERCVNEIVFSALPPPSGSGRAPPRLNTNFDGDMDGGADQGSFDYGYNPNNNGGGLSMQNTGISSIGMQNTEMTGMSQGMSSPYDRDAGMGFGMANTGNSGFLPPPDVGSGLMDTGVGGTSPGGSSSFMASPYQPPSASAPSPGGTYSSASVQGRRRCGRGCRCRDGGRGGRRCGRGLSSTGAGGAAGGRFATFPVRSRGYSLRDDGGAAGSGSGTGGTEAPPSLGATRRQDTSGSDFMSAVLDAGEFGTRQQGQQPPMPQQQQQQQQQSSSQFSQYSLKNQEREREMERQRQQEEEPVPEYRVEYEPTSHSQVFEYPGALPPGPPPGAAAPVVGSVWAGGEREREPSAPGGMMRNPSNLTVEEGGGDRQSTFSTASEDFGLAYMNMGDDPADEAPLEGEGEKERQARLSKHVRFGDASEFMEPPQAPYMKREPSSSSLRGKRVPPPTFDPVEDERALNAAAAREVSRELDALSFSPPPVAPPQVQVQTESAGWEFATPSPQQQPPSPPSKRSNEYTSSSSSSPPQTQYQPPASPPQNQYTSPPPPANQYAPPPPPANREREASPRIPPAARKATLDNPNALPPGARHQNTPSWDAQPMEPAQPAPFQPGHHTTPSWAITPPPPVDSPASPSSPRLDSPYRAPVASRSTSSLNAQVPPGARTISAAAFRRPQKTASGDVGDTSPLALKKRLPASPYPQARAGSALRDASPQPPPQQQDDESFDYISAYANGGRDSQAFHDEGSPMEANFDYGRLGKVEVVGGPPMSPGYSEGRFATDLDPDGVR
ncbi:hypothetical protein B0H19DRAFT_1072907 [Mycena capillaripes]|nr:hypothetical protein B0H19DRAFT_1072907 [Mycena capillaripes]